MRHTWVAMRSAMNLLKQSQELRKMAAEVHQRRDKLKKEAVRMFKTNNKFMATELAGKAQSLKRQADEYSLKAAKLCYQYYNSNENLNSIDLHGLSTSEARYYLGQFMQTLIKRNQTFFDVYVGRGNNSTNGPRLNETVHDLCYSLDIYCENPEPGKWYLDMGRGFDYNLFS